MVKVTDGQGRRLSEAYRVTTFCRDAKAEHFLFFCEFRVFVRLDHSQVLKVAFRLKDVLFHGQAAYNAVRLAGSLTLVGHQSVVHLLLGRTVFQRSLVPILQVLKAVVIRYVINQQHSLKHQSVRNHK